MTEPRAVSPLSLNRLSLYLRCLHELRDQGVSRVSSQQLATQLRVSAALIRKDLAQFGEFGIRGIGYEVEALIDRLRGLLGLDREHRLAVIGMGRLGSALASYLEFNQGAFRVVAGFDTDPEKVGTRVGHLVVHHVRDLAKIIGQTRAQIALLTVPPEAAQSSCEALERAGIRAVLNFAPVQLHPRRDLVSKSVDVRVHLEELAFFLRS